MALDFILRLRIAIVRFLLSYNDAQERKEEPQPPDPVFIESIPSTSPRGFVRLHFYHQHERTHDAGTAKSPRPLVIDFHGGGFSSGHPSMDARWIASLLTTATTRPVVVGVEYSLAPENPFPAALQDASATITYLANEGAMKHNLDSSRVMLSGFSAGGVLALTAPIWMHEQEQTIDPRLRGILSVYPNIDFRIPRHESPTGLATFLNTTWNKAFARRSPVESPIMSPAAASDGQLRTMLPDVIALYPVADDPLCAPCESFRERLQALGKRVTGQVEPDATHAWDKLPLRRGDTQQAELRWAKRHEWFRRMAQDVNDMLR